MMELLFRGMPSESQKLIDGNLDSFHMQRVQKAVLAHINNSLIEEAYFYKFDRADGCL